MEHNMTIRSMFNMINGIDADGDNAHLRSDSPLGANKASNLASQGTVQKVSSNGYHVDVGGRQVVATAATDEPIQASQSVWLSRTAEGNWFIHGSVK